MGYDYYIGEGEGAQRIIDRLVSRRNESNELRTVLCEKYDARGLVTNSDGKVIGLGFSEERTDHFLRCEPVGFEYYTYVPNIRTKKGRQLRDELENPSLTFDHREFLLQELNMEQTWWKNPYTPLRVFAKVVWDKRILVSVPNDVDDLPDIPDWLEKVDEEEWLKAAQRV